MKYKLIQKINPLKPSLQRKWYANTVKAGTINKYQLSKIIAIKSSLTRTTVLKIIESLIEEIPQHLIEGYSINLNDLGTLRITLSSEGTDDPKKFENSNIKNSRVIFTIAPEFKKILENIEFEEVE